ncbi:ubiquitin-conjugating enzyme domain-containing protein, putative [Eimeria mitis]|uniref:Ubiquitin-conjugating enzyme domain-containing protein, putative n=1 Tax=Eimeria mitis TaxID=44415 RepID=U6K612_9EIME|nr:ubiquitin-conjugating enzyme domain-containing protein, putative [Eimeria mitis]CDJ33430.1 ubiquitin-conjugating enzyme domain-containing protein, putative [Eimeria mitis]
MEEDLEIPAAALRRVDSGRSRLLLDDELLQLSSSSSSSSSSMQQQQQQMEQQAAAAAAAAATRTVLPICKELLAGVDANGCDVPVDPKTVEQTLDLYSVLIE